MRVPNTVFKIWPRLSAPKRAAALKRARRLLMPALIFVLLPCCAPKESAPLQIFAAASLRDVFTDLKQQFESVYPESVIRLSFAGSHVLRLQIQNGAQADLFASAHQSHLDTLVQSGQVSAYAPFATNQIALITPKGNPSSIQHYHELPKVKRLVLGSSDVPIGHYTEQLLSRTRLRLGEPFHQTVMTKVVSRETNSRLVRAKVELGAADAAFVYHTDAISSAHVTTIPIAAEDNVEVRYYQGKLSTSTREATAKQWTSFIGSEAGRTILHKHGFGSIP